MGNEDVEFDDEEWGVPVPEAAFEELEEFAPLEGEAAAAEERNLGLPIDRALVVETMATLSGRVPYQIGTVNGKLVGKPSSLKLTTEQFLAERKAPNGVDCSGFVRWLLYRTSEGRVRIPDGSWNQMEHFRALGKAAAVPPVTYDACTRRDGVLRVAGFTASKARKIPVGHIWLVLDGETCESRGKHGVSRRAWDTPALVKLVTWCYPIARP